MPTRLGHRDAEGNQLMNTDKGNLQRILHFKFRSPTADTSQLVALIQSAMPFYQASGVTRARLLRNVDDPSSFIQVLEYEVSEMIEMNCQAIAGDSMMQGYLRAWRSLIPGGVEVDVFEEVKLAHRSSRLLHPSPERGGWLRASARSRVGLLHDSKVSPTRRLRRHPPPQAGEG